MCILTYSPLKLRQVWSFSNRSEGTYIKQVYIKQTGIIKLITNFGLLVLIIRIMCYP